MTNEPQDFQVSLCRTYQDECRKGTLQFPYITQPKLDGVRCVIRLGSDGLPHAYSRNGNEFVGCLDHILQAPGLLDCFKFWPDMVLDGEVYDHSRSLKFEDICSCVKRKTLTDRERKLLKYHCFDMFVPHDPDMPFALRHFFLGLALDGVDTDLVKLVGIDVASTPEEVETQLASYVKDGYEGIILRTNSPYSFGRSSNLLKYKRFRDSEYIITEVHEGKGKAKGSIAALSLVDRQGHGFKAAAHLNNIPRRRWKGMVGKRATVKYQELTMYGVPRFGQVVGVRDYE